MIPQLCAAERLQRFCLRSRLAYSSPTPPKPFPRSATLRPRRRPLRMARRANPHALPSLFHGIPRLAAASARHAALSTRRSAAAACLPSPSVLRFGVLCCVPSHSASHTRLQSPALAPTPCAPSPSSPTVGVFALRTPSIYCALILTPSDSLPLTAGRQSLGLAH